MSRLIHLQTLVLLATAGLLVALCFTSPFSPKFRFFDVRYSGTAYTFGTFGYCADAKCSPRSLGYDLSGLVRGATGNAVSNKYNNLTKALITVPIAGGLAGLAALVSLFSSGFGLSVLMSMLAFIAAALATACEWALFYILRKQVQNLSGATISASAGYWMVLAAGILAVLSPFVGCAARSAARRQQYVPVPPPQQYPFAQASVGSGRNWHGSV